MNDIMTPASGPTPIGAARNATYGEMTPVVQAFFARLTRLPLEAWIRISVPKAEWASDVALVEKPDTDPETASARARLRSVMEQMPSALVRAKRRVYDITDVASGLTAEAVRAPMTRAALTAALALIARPYLSAQEFVRLYHPFSELIPVETLEAAALATGEHRLSS
jgi:hypothetical protein